MKFSKVLLKRKAKSGNELVPFGGVVEIGSHYVALTVQGPVLAM